MPPVETSADLLDPGEKGALSNSEATGVSVMVNQVTSVPVPGSDSVEISASQVRQFLEEDMEEGEIAESCSSQLHDHPSSVASRKRKAQSDQGLPSNELRSKRFNPECIFEDGTSNLRTATPTHEVSQRRKDGSCVLLVRPANESSKKMLTSPEALCEALEADPFKSIPISDVRVNRRQGLLAIEVADKDRSSLDTLLQVTQLGKWDVICSLPNQDKFCYGVVAPIDLESNLDALSKRVRVQGSATFVKMERLTRSVNGVRQPSTSLRLVFEGSELPKNIKIGYHSYSVRKYTFPPLQCFHCQRFGHSAQGCNSPRRCLLCAGSHHFSDCQSSTRRCANCGGEHKANSPSCVRAPRVAERLQPRGATVGGEYVRGSGVWVSRPSQMGASVAVGAGRSSGLSQPSPRGRSGQVMQRVEVSADVHHCLNSPVPGFSSPAYSQIVAGHSPSPCGFPGFAPSSTPSLPSSIAPADAHPSSLPVSTDFLSSLSNCLVDLFSLSLHKESPSKARSLIGAAVQKHFGVTLPSLSTIVPDTAAVADVSPESPGPGSVCSARDELSACLGVDDFRLVSDSEMSAEGEGEVCDRMASDKPQKEGGGVLPIRGISDLKGSSPTPSPVLGPQRRTQGRGGTGAAHASGSKSVRGSASARGRTRSSTRK